MRDDSLPALEVLLLERSKQSRLRRRKAFRIARIAAGMLRKNLHTGSGCRSVAAAIANRTK